MPSPESWEGDYYIPNLDYEHEDAEEDWPFDTDEEKNGGLYIIKLWRK